MRNPRRIRLTEELIQKHQLSTNPPPADSLFWKLWDSSKSIAEKSLETDFLKGLRKGNLDPIKFGSFNVSDAYYCFKGTDYYETAVKRTDNPILKEFLLQKVESYVDYNKRFVDTWFIKDASAIVPPPICYEYSDYESKISGQEDPIYTLILMLPCEYLWAWISETMLPIASENIYGNWIRENLIPEIAYAMGNFIDLYLKSNPDAIDENKAMEIYKQAMEYEYRYFLSATE